MKPKNNPEVRAELDLRIRTSLIGQVATLGREDRAQFKLRLFLRITISTRQHAEAELRTLYVPLP